MQQIYTIPVNEAFDLCREKPETGCPLCALYRKLQEDELDIILGASMMEPDIRIMTNELGFCGTHYGMMLKRKRMLGMGLMLESHLAEVEAKLDAKWPPVVGAVGGNIEPLVKLGESCYVCSRIKKNLDAMTATTVYLFETDRAFREKFAAQSFFCLPHYSAMLSYASKKMNKKNYRELLEVAHGIEKKYIQSLSGDVSWFCKKFDYRYDAEPWYNSKDSIPRAIKFLSSDTDETKENGR